MLTISSNFTRYDFERVNLFLPKLIKVFDKYFDELLFFYDEGPEVGRIKKLHSSKNVTTFDEDQIQDILNLDSRIKIVKLDESILKLTSIHFFKNEHVLKCSAGTPISHFLNVFLLAKNQYIFRCDCDVFFYDNGFINLSIDKIRQNQIFVQPPSHFSSERTFSTRAFFANKDALNNCLPIKPLKRGLKTIIKCYLSGNYVSPYYSLEEMLQTYFHNQTTYIDRYYGDTLHVCTRDEFTLTNFSKNMDRFLCGDIPKKQKEFSINYNHNLWD